MKYTGHIRPTKASMEEHKEEIFSKINEGLSAGVLSRKIGWSNDRVFRLWIRQYPEMDARVRENARRYMKEIGVKCGHFGSDYNRKVSTCLI